MIQIDAYQKSDYEALNYKLPTEQLIFTSNIATCLASDVQSNIHKRLLTIRHRHSIVGFFILDQSNDKFLLSENRDAIVVRSFSINPLYQGKGIGKKAMMAVADYVKINFSYITEIVLSVNVKNKSAYHTYLKAGFMDTGKCMDGPFGLQNILSQKLL